MMFYKLLFTRTPHPLSPLYNTLHTQLEHPNISLTPLPHSLHNSTLEARQKTIIHIVDIARYTTTPHHTPAILHTSDDISFCGCEMKTSFTSCNVPPPPYPTTHHHITLHPTLSHYTPPYHTTHHPITLHPTLSYYTPPYPRNATNQCRNENILYKLQCSTPTLSHYTPPYHSTPNPIPLHPTISHYTPPYPRNTTNQCRCLSLRLK